MKNLDLKAGTGVIEIHYQLQTLVDSTYRLRSTKKIKFVNFIRNMPSCTRWFTLSEPEARRGYMAGLTDAAPEKVFWEISFRHGPSNDSLFFTDPEAVINHITSKYPESLVGLVLNS